jgi:hypothetical protein
VEELLAQAKLLRDIFGDRLPQTSRESPWLPPSVVALAQTIYDGRAFERMPELAAALEAGGIADDALLSDARGPGPHVRGCWALDWVLGKET